MILSNKVLSKEEYLEYVLWLGSDPVIPGGRTTLSVWKELCSSGEAGKEVLDSPLSSLLVEGDHQQSSKGDSCECSRKRETAVVFDKYKDDAKGLLQKELEEWLE